LKAIRSIGQNDLITSFDVLEFDRSDQKNQFHVLALSLGRVCLKTSSAASLYDVDGSGNHVVQRTDGRQTCSSLRR